MNTTTNCTTHLKYAMILFYYILDNCSNTQKYLLPKKLERSIDTEEKTDRRRSYYYYYWTTTYSEIARRRRRDISMKNDFDIKVKYIK